MIKKLLLLLVMLSFASMASWAGDIEDRLDELEAMAEEAAIANENEMKVSGYIDTEFTWLMDTKDTSKHDTANGYRIHHFSLFFTKKLADNIRFASEIEFEDGPKFEAKTSTTLKDAQGKIFVEAVNIDILSSPMANYRIGRFFTPAGIWSIDHYPPFVATQQRPQHIRKIFPQLIDGAMVYGTVAAGETYINYDLYTGNGEGNNGHGDGNNGKSVGLKVSAIFPALTHTEVGFSTYSDNPNGKEDEKSAVGVHAKVQADDFTFQAEHATSTQNNGAADDKEQKGYYAQFLYDINDWTVGFRHDVLDKKTEDSADSAKTYNSVIVNYHVTPTIVGKLEVHDITDETKQDANGDDENYRQVTLSIAAYLGN